MSQRRDRLGRIRSAALKGAAALAVGACLTVGAGAGLAHAATPPDPLKNWSVAHIEATSIANAEAASSITLSGSFTESGQTITLNIGFEKGVGCKATIAESKLGTVKMIVIGNAVYLRLNEQFWTSVAGAKGAALAAQLNGRYIKVSPTSSLAKSLTAVCNLQGELTGGSPNVTVHRGAVSTLDGVRVLELKNSNGDDVYVTDSWKPEIFAATSAKGSANGAGTFRVNVCAKVTVVAPPASDVVSGAKYGF